MRHDEKSAKGFRENKEYKELHGGIEVKHRCDVLS
jgi:hypothetical protein